MDKADLRRDSFRAAIDSFLNDRRDSRLKEAEEGGKDELENVRRQYSFENWFPRIVSQAKQVQLTTHPLKTTFPDAKISSTTSLYCPPNELPERAELGSHSLSDTFHEDTVGNAAVSASTRNDLRMFMCWRVAGKPMRHWILDADLDLLRALHSDSTIAQGWLDGLRTFLVRPEPAQSHSRAKQLFWLVGDDPADDANYHLLAPLYSSALAHAVFHILNEDRFGDAGKAARQARREQRDHDTGYREYPNLAVQKLGGSKPQNISQLNSERRGNNYLLSSLPPSWKTRPVNAPLHIDSVFPRFGRIGEVRPVVRELREFLLSDPPPNKETRNRRDALIDRLIDELVDFAHPLQATLPAGWTQHADCRLVEAERLWLDPGRAEIEEAGDADFRAAWQHMDWPAEIGKRFGNWLNGELGHTLPLGDIVGRHWRDELLSHTEWADTLHRQQKRLAAPTDIPVREATR